MKTITNIFVSLFYSGYFKLWPGTFASVISILILFPVIKYQLVSKEIFIYIFFIMFTISIFFIKKFSLYTNTHDSGKIVIDEFLGIYLIFIFYDLIYIFNDFITIMLVFIFFRFFDIVKIFPANIIDKKMNNSLGVLLDDIIASIYTILFIYTFSQFF
jgi:phosphatidylglycerophosphatase A